MHAPGGESGPGHAPGSRADAQKGTRDGTPPDLLESLREVHAAGRSSLGAAGEAAKAFRTLFSADISLARSAMGRALAFGGVAIIFGASAWLLAMGAVVTGLVRALDWPFWVALVATSLLSAGVAAYGGWRAMYYFEYTRLRATRRQLARLGFGELADYTPDPGSPESTREATKRLAEQDTPLKDDQGIDVTPP